MDIQPQDLSAIGLLIFLEGILSIDNALAIAVIAKRLPNKADQKKALTYGLVGAIAFRIGALMLASLLMQWLWIKFIGGAYLIYMAVSHWISNKNENDHINTSQVVQSFWKTVLIIELTDIAFAVDSILAAVAVSKKLWVVVTGGIIGLIMMRFAAQVFINLLQKFPRFENTAYLLILGIGLKLFIDGFQFDAIHFHDKSNPAFWAFWIYTAVSIALGFRKPSQKDKDDVVDEIEMLEKQKESVKDIESLD